MRSVQPIFNEKNILVGTLSVGSKIANFPYLFKKVSEDDAIFLNDLNITNNLKPKHFEEFIKEATIFDNKVASSSTMEISINDLKRVDTSKPWSVLNIGDKHYGIHILYLKDFNSNPMFRMVVFHDLTKSYNEFKDDIFKEIAIIFGVVIFIYFLLLRQANRSLKKIEKLSKLSQELYSQNFETLHLFKIDTKSDDEVDILSKNIVNMGFALKAFYNDLQRIIDKKTKEVKKVLYIDGLTGLYNRKALEEDLREKHGRTLIFIDIDSFSNINDFFGTSIGNSVLVHVAKMLKILEKRLGIDVYRIGSDEFAILSISKKYEELLQIILRDFSSVIVKHTPDDVEINLDFTFGLSFGTSLTLEKSDIALHEAKQKKLRYAIYSDKLLSRDVHEKNISLSKKIRDGIKHDHFTLFYQPIFNQNREIVKYEALVRLLDGERYLTPFHFLPYAKKTKYYFDITKIVIEKSFERFEKIDKSFSINLSADDIVNSEISNFIEHKLSKFNRPQNVTFEILESEQIEKLEPILDFIDKVRRYGSKIAIDDFGSGYSNFSYLLDIKPDYLKLDGSIVKGIASNRDSYLVAKSIVDFAKASNFTTIAEFVDCEDVFQKAKNMGVDMFQGYYLAMPSSEIEDENKN
jgi:diguanylate cyclase (GGDEF)-like protein